MNTLYRSIKPLKKPFYHLLILLALLSPLKTVYCAKLPDLGSSDLIVYNIELEQELGRAFNTALHTQYNLNYDPDVITYIRKIGHYIASQTGLSREFRFYIIDNPSINAFAGPNGIIGIHTGLILAAKNEDELAAVIAHEIAHVTQNHLSRGHEVNSQQSSVNTIATLLAAILIGMYDSTAVYPTLMAGFSLNIEQQLKNSRLYESEADHIGIKFLSQAGYEPHAMADFFARLAKESQNNEFQLPEILRSHPVTERRIVEAKNRAQTLATTHVKKANNDFHLIQLKLTTHSNADTERNNQATSTAEKCYQNNLQTLFHPAQPSSHIQCLALLVQQNPNHTLYTTLFLQVLAQHPHPSPDLITKAINQADYLLALYPSNTAVLLNYAQLLLSTNNRNRAITLLKTHTENQRYTYLAYKKLSEIYAKQQQTAEAHFFLALAQFNIGNLKRTQYLLRQAKTTAGNSLKQRITLFEHKNSNLLKSKKISKH